MVGKGKQIRLNTKDKNKEQVDFVFYYWIQVQFDYWIIHFMDHVDYWINKPNHFSIHEFISPLVTFPDFHTSEKCRTK